MGTSTQKIAKMSLIIDFDLHTDGDEEFKRELIILMIDNVHELKATLKMAIEQNDITLFRECVHKVTPTINILDFKEFTELIEAIKHETDSSKQKVTVVGFDEMCEDIIAVLKREIEQ
jgi:hypothetical protein